jgi:hypothetical protein
MHQDALLAGADQILSKPPQPVNANSVQIQINFFLDDREMVSQSDSPISGRFSGSANERLQNRFRKPSINRCGSNAADEVAYREKMVISASRQLDDHICLFDCGVRNGHLPTHLDRHNQRFVQLAAALFIRLQDGQPPHWTCHFPCSGTSCSCAPEGLPRTRKASG